MSTADQQTSALQAYSKVYKETKEKNIWKKIKECMKDGMTKKNRRSLKVHHNAEYCTGQFHSFKLC